MRRHLLVSAFLGLALLTGVVASAATYRYELFHVDGMLGTSGTGINNEGVVVGSVSYGSNARDRSGFLRTPDGELTVINYPGQVGTQLHGINNQGQSIASYLQAGGGFRSFLVEADGSFSEILRSEPADINDVGQVLGGPYYEIYLWDADGEIAWSTGYDYVSAGGVNNRGLVAYSREYLEDGFYRWHSHIADTAHGGREPVDYPGAHDTFVSGINNLDEVIGTWQSLSREEFGAFLRRADGSFEELTPPGPGVFSPRDINDLGQITGVFRPEGASTSYGFIGTPVPEPATIVVFAIAALPLAFVFRRK